jgi:UDP-glucose 4-epimerase
MVTGADGFIGSHLTERLVREGATVRAVCYYNSMGSWGWLDESDEDVRAALEVRLGDIRDGGFMEAAARDVEVVFHLAALVAIPYSYVAPQSFVDTNVSGTLNVLEAVRRAGVGRLVHTSTSEVYGTPDDIPIRETHALRGQSPYSASKIAADKLCEAYRCSFDTPVVILRPFNTYGPRQSMRAVLPTILQQLLAGRTTVHLGDLRPKRDLTYVTDTVEGLIRAGATPGIEGEVIQLGTGRAVSIAELFQLACEATGRRATAETDAERLRPASSEVMVLQSDPRRARELLGWEPHTPLEEGLRLTAQWCERHVARHRVDVYHV